MKHIEAILKVDFGGEHHLYQGWSITSVHPQYYPQCYSVNMVNNQCTLHAKSLFTCQTIQIEYTKIYV